MNEIKGYKEKKFDSFLNKTIILTSKRYFKKKMNILRKERTIMDDECYSVFLQDFIDFNDALFSIDDIECRVELNKALNSLSAIEQAVIFLLFQKKLSLDEAAQILEICSKSVSRIKLRAISKLKEYFEGDVEDGK